MGAGCAPCLWYLTRHAGASGSKRRVVGVARTHDGTFSPILPFRRVRLAATRDCAYAQVRIFARPLAFAQLTGRRLAKIEVVRTHDAEFLPKSTPERPLVADTYIRAYAQMRLSVERDVGGPAPKSRPMALCSEPPAPALLSLARQALPRQRPHGLLEGDLSVRQKCDLRE